MSFLFHEITWQYFLLTFFSCLGILQLAAVRAGRKYLQLFSSKPANIFLGLACVLISYVLFFTQASYAIKSIKGIVLHPKFYPPMSPFYQCPWPRLEGAQLFGVFLFSALLSVIFCLFINLIRHSNKEQILSLASSRISQAYEEIKLAISPRTYKKESNYRGS